MRIKEIKIKGYKSIADQSVALNPINILIGSNGIGKSNFISVFEFLKDIYDQQLQRFVIEHGGAGALLYMGRRTTDEIIIDITFEHDSNENRFVVELSESQDRLFISKSFTSFLSGNWHNQPIDSNTEESNLKNENHGQTYYVNPLLSDFEIYHFHDTGAKSPIKGYKQISDNRKLRRDGANLAPFLYYLKLRHEKHYKLIEHFVASVTPYFGGFCLEPNPLQPETIRLEWKHKCSSDVIFSDWQMSDGTLRFICLATLLLQPDCPDVVLIDEPELGLHPQAINKLASLIKKMSNTTQFIISTQSVSFIDNFEVEDVLVVNNNRSASEYKRLDSESLKSWLEEYSLGDIWEMNIIGGQPL